MDEKDKKEPGLVEGLVITGKTIVDGEIQKFRAKNPGEAMLMEGAARIAAQKAKDNPTAATLGLVGLATGRTVAIAVAAAGAEVVTRNSGAVESVSRRGGKALGGLLKGALAKAEGLAGQAADRVFAGEQATEEPTQDQAAEVPEADVAEEQTAETNTVQADDPAPRL